MGLKINESTFTHGDELQNVLLRGIDKDKSINGCKRQLVKFMEKRALWMWWVVYSHQLCIPQSWILKMQQGEGDCGAGAGGHLLSPCLSQRSYKHETGTVLTYPSRLLSSTLSPVCPQPW